MQTNQAALIAIGYVWIAAFQTAQSVPLAEVQAALNATRDSSQRELQVVRSAAILLADSSSVKSATRSPSYRLHKGARHANQASLLTQPMGSAAVQPASWISALSVPFSALTSVTSASKDMSSTEPLNFVRIQLAKWSSAAAASLMSRLSAKFAILVTNTTL